MNLADLQKECQKLGLATESSKARLPYLEALRGYYLKRDFPNGLPYTELTPMLCCDYWRLGDKLQKVIWKDHNWIAQQKINGIRLIVHFVKGVGVFAHSRVVSVRTYRRSELTDQLPFKSFIPDFTATIDAEMTTPFKLHVFDITNWQGTDLRLRKLSERLAYLKDFQAVTTRLSESIEFLRSSKGNRRCTTRSLQREGKELFSRM